MTQPTLLELAKQGNQEAIASVMNYLLKDKGITAKAIQNDARLVVVLESAQVPEQTASVASIHKLMMQLNVASIKSVKVYGKQAGHPATAWIDTLNLTTEVEESKKHKVEESKKHKVEESKKHKVEEPKKHKVEEPKKQTSSSESLWQGKLKAIADRWPAWFPYPSSWLRALSLAVPTYAGVAVLSLEFWRSLYRVILLATKKSPDVDAFILLTVALLVASLIVYLVFVVLFSLVLRLFWRKAPEKMGLGLYGFVVTTLASLFSFLPFLGSVYFDEALVVIIQKSVRDEWQVITKLFSYWFVPAAYLYQAEYLTQQRLIPKLNAALRNSEFLRNGSRWKSQKLAKKLLIILLIPLAIAGAYLFSKLPELKEIIPVPIASQAPSVTPTPITPASPATSSPQLDPFREAVNKATSASNMTQSAKSKDNWNLVASQWEEAIALMKAVPPSHPQYSTGQQKVVEYQRNLDYAQKNAATNQ